MTQALVVPQLSDEQLRRRLQVAHAPGFGLADATPSQLEMVYLLCQRYRLDPELHLTLYRGRPFVTIDGRVELARRNPEYLDFRTRPLSKEEKTAWDYRADDLVVECTIRTRTGAEFSSRGKVSGEERKKNSPTGTNPQEMAEKRAFARTSRLAFGQSAYLDDDDLEQEPDPKEQARLAQRYTEIFPQDEEPPAVQQEQAQQVVDRAQKAASQREMDLQEIDRQRREEGLI